MVKMEFECRISAHDPATGFNRVMVVKQDHILKFNIDFNIHVMKMATEAADYAKAHEQDEMEKNRELPF